VNYTACRMVFTASFDSAPGFCIHEGKAMRHLRWICVAGLLAFSTVPASIAGSDDAQSIRMQIPNCGSLQEFVIPASAIGLPTSGAAVQTATPVSATEKGNVNGEYCKVIGIIKPVNPQNPLSFDEKKWKDRIIAVGSIMDVTDISLEKFRAKGGKIILTHGTTDDFITPYNSIAYYERQVKQFTKPVVDSFIWFYMIRGAGHGFGPFNPQFETLPVLQNWVENKQAPRRLTAIDGNKNANRSRPLCEWPAWPKFTGAPGTENDAGGYTCVTQ
jgi:hypothetical protein